MLRSVLMVAAGITLPLAAAAQTQSAGDAGRTPQRVRSVTLQGNEACPPSQGDEVVVCSRINPDEQFRIPKELRNTAEPAAKNQAWTNRVAVADRASRVNGGVPDSCSPVGSAGQTGCALAINNAFKAEKRAAEKNDSMIPGGR
ncbi:hypothetical protein [Sphingomonas sp. BK235]|jgi:hypothetical protein|uniref:hypothetical protein n=1 Tax=Sphingomonas sp. BK235 TaxID=2512131 RepID=UPI00104D98FB|nr:hypothetical protein [Sphingomonas sp. BK235]TCP37502.1 hypothetical protein EV292_1011026 [Sphingomonas sp. BK235]